MSSLLHLTTGAAVDQAILSEQDRVVILIFGTDQDQTCQRLDELFYSITESIKNIAVAYLVDINEVPDFNIMYEIHDPCTVMFFFRNKHIMVDLGSSKIARINWAQSSKQDLIDLVETVFRGARKGRGLIVSPKDFSLQSNNTYLDFLRSKL